MSERLIDANDLKTNIPVAYPSVIDAIDNAPTVDAVRVVHGRWYTADEDGYELAECSVCGGRSYDDLSDYPYCPMCGAKMDEEKGESE